MQFADFTFPVSVRIEQFPLNGRNNSFSMETGTKINGSLLINYYLYIVCQNCAVCK